MGDGDLTHYLIWKLETPEESMAAFNRLNNLADIPSTPLLQQWALRFELNYPNAAGTNRWADPLVCNNPASSYYEAVAMPVLDAVWESLTPQIVTDLIEAGGITRPTYGLDEPMVALPADWDSQDLNPN